MRAPGTYQASGQIHLSDAVHLAGGLAPDAQTEDAQVFRYLPDGKLKIFSVSLSGALAGDPTANILLEPRDRLLIHRNPDEAQPATVYVQGEVGKPGRYPLTTNMKVADLIQVGGGLKPSAFTESADLTRYEFANQGSTRRPARSGRDFRSPCGRFDGEPASEKWRRDHDPAARGMERSGSLHSGAGRSESCGNITVSARASA